MSTRLIQLVENFPRARVLLVGDLMLDRYIYGNAERLSPEAPVPVLHYEREELRLGGAGNVAANLTTLGATVQVVGVIGNDPLGEQMLQMLKACNCDPTHIIATGDRPTICKLRLVGYAQHKNPQQLMRVDFENPEMIDASLESRLIEAACRAMSDADILCIEDYNKGLLTPQLTQRLIRRAKELSIPVIIDPARIADYGKYAGATAIKSNRPEAERATGLPVRKPEDFSAAAEKMLQTLDLEAVIVTLDRQGSYLATRDGQRRWLKTRERQVADGTGAGDMMLAAITMARAAGASWEEAGALANVAGGLEVEKLGVVPIRPEEIIHDLLADGLEHLGKQRGIGDLLAELNAHRANGKRVVFTNGCFDIVHLGHVKYFQWAKQQGDLLVVGVNTDAGIRRLKGEKRPIIGEVDRLGVLEELQSIDYLVSFDDDTPIKLIEQIRPDVLVKGADYTKQQVVGWDFVESYGGKIALAPLIDGRSTSSVIERILQAYS
jgi:D-beta-D-heptose 7-phosphate kinase/D-beta-D-heptose 1-phosphate adenosyltransferase